MPLPQMVSKRILKIKKLKTIKIESKIAMKLKQTHKMVVDMKKHLA